MPDYANRKWVRLKDYDYSSDGYYFLTVCTKNQKQVLSQIIVNAENKAEVKLSEYGKIAEKFLKSVPGIDAYVIMPNHIHMIIHKTNGKPIASDVRSFKGLVTKAIGESIWQAYYHDHVIRDDRDFLLHLQYIDENPAKWLLGKDEYYG